jgi:ATP-dependent Clp protease ATP-binding subunit ClpX
MFRLDNVKLEFTREALEAAAERALGHQTGARCLRYIIEETLTDVMYELPSLENVARCIVDRDAIKGIGSPKLITKEGETLTLPCPPMQKLA